MLSPAPEGTVSAITRGHLASTRFSINIPSDPANPWFPKMVAETATSRMENIITEHILAIRFLLADLAGADLSGSCTSNLCAASTATVTSCCGGAERFIGSTIVLPNFNVSGPAAAGSSGYNDT